MGNFIMGKLRIEPKVKPLLDEEEYDFYKSVLLEARRNARDNILFWDLDPGENARKTKKAFAYVAEKEGISLVVRAKRGSNSLVLNFKEPKGSRKQEKRISAEECIKRILGVLRKSDVPLNKSQIVSAAGVSSSTWNIRVKDMLKKGTIAKQGAGRQTTYHLPK